MDNDHTFLFSTEIEASLVSILWRHPEFLPEFLKQCDPRIHLCQTHCQIITEAINLVDARVGATDFATVTQAVREMGRFDECGGLVGLNDVYSAHEPTKHTQALFKHYVEALKTYAENRSKEPPKPTFVYIGGRGTLDPNHNRHSDKSPTHTGIAKIRGFTYNVTAYQNAKFTNLRFEPITR
jgi:hypothetical protein